MASALLDLRRNMARTSDIEILLSVLAAMRTLPRRGGCRDREAGNHGLAMAEGGDTAAHRRIQGARGNASGANPGVAGRQSDASDSDKVTVRRMPRGRFGEIPTWRCSDAPMWSSRDSVRRQ